MSEICLKETGGVDGSSFNISIENPLLFGLSHNPWKFLSVVI
jgi:hypothetical protein